MKCVILVEDPTNHLNSTGVDWSRTGGDPEVFLESKKVWEKARENLDEDFKIVFCSVDPNIPEETPRLENGTMWLNGSRKDSEMLKFVADVFAFTHKNFEYDFILATTLGSFWVIDRLKKALECLPRTGIYTGRKWDAGSLAWPPWEFISGSGAVFSRDVIELFLKKRSMTDRVSHPCGDAIIGLFMLQNGIEVLRQDWWMDLDQNTLEGLDERIRDGDSRGIAHYRVKNCANRLYFDPIILNRLYDWYSRA